MRLVPSRLIASATSCAPTHSWRASLTCASADKTSTLFRPTARQIRQNIFGMRDAASALQESDVVEADRRD